MRERVFILPGRHQPPHNDHLAIIRRALELIDVELHIALITRDPASPSPRSELERESLEHHTADRTPFTFTERRRFVRAMLTPLENARVQVIALPQPETAWSFVTAIFPEERTWIVPIVGAGDGEKLDALKAAFFAERGDRVLRIPIVPTTDGRRVRELARRRDPELALHVPAPIASAIFAKKGAP